MGYTTMNYQLHPTVESRFNKKYIVDPITGCYNWTAGQDPEGYGVIWDSAIKNNRRAARVAVMLSGRVIPDGMMVLHQCDNKKCVNEKHITIGTNYQNQIEARDRGLLKDTPRKRKELIQKMTDDEFLVWSKKFDGKTGKAMGNLIAAKKWRAE